jgi:hypothetical protein
MDYRILLGVGLSAVLPGCFVDAGGGGGSGPVVVDSGSLILDWTIDGTKDPDQCDQADAATLDVIVSSANGASAGEFQQSCRAFATTIDLAPGSYSADAVLLDSAGEARTTSVPVHAFEILGNDELSIPIDFSAGSFLAP